MKKIFISNCTEYEASWQRPDGFMISDNKEALMIQIAELSNGSQELFWRYDEPQKIYCTNNTYKKIMVKINEKGVAHFNSGKKNKLKLFKRI